MVFSSKPEFHRKSSWIPGIGTLAVEVTHMSKHGFWVLQDDEELAIPFSDFPWFKSATIEQLCEIELDNKQIAAFHGL